jgi:hypothetical protein
MKITALNALIARPSTINTAILQAQIAGFPLGNAGLAAERRSRSCGRCSSVRSITPSSEDYFLVIIVTVIFVTCREDTDSAIGFPVPK